MTLRLAGNPGIWHGHFLQDRPFHQCSAHIFFGNDINHNDTLRIRYIGQISEQLNPI